MDIFVLRNSTANQHYAPSVVHWFETTADGQTLIDQGYGTVLSTQAAAVAAVLASATTTMHTHFASGHNDYMRIIDDRDPHTLRRLAALSLSPSLNIG